jgi:hypothetical protein
MLRIHSVDEQLAVFQERSSALEVAGGGQAVEKWLRYYATSRKVEGSKRNEVDELLSIYLILPAALSPGVYSASKRNEYRKQRNNVSGKQSVAARRADNFDAI